jgi:hypothetical protein
VYDQKKVDNKARKGIKITITPFQRSLSSAARAPQIQHPKPADIQNEAHTCSHRHLLRHRLCGTHRNCLYAYPIQANCPIDLTLHSS